MSNWKEFVDLPQSTSATPLKARLSSVDNIRQDQTNDKKRGPSTPLTPSLIRRNILKKQVMEHRSRELMDNEAGADEFKIPEDPPTTNDADVSQVMKEFNDQLEQEGTVFADGGSPKLRRTSMGPLRELASQAQNLTPRITTGIKLAVKEHKKSRLQMLKAPTRAEDSSFSDAEYTEVSTIAGDTPSYKFKENLVYYKNGYYIDNVDESFAEFERSQIITEKELVRVNNLVDFLKLERLLGSEVDGQSED